MIDVDQRLTEHLCEQMAAWARELFANLPASEVTEDEPLHFALGPTGLFVSLDRSGYLYGLFQGHTVRVRTVNGEAELSTWKDGHVVELETRPMAELKAWLRTWPLSRTIDNAEHMC